MRPTRRALFPSLPIICTLAAVVAAVNARTATRTAAAAAQTNAASQSAATLQTSPAQEPRVFHVTVVDSKGNLVTGVRREDLNAFDGGEQREIVSFGTDDVPASVVFLIDTSSSAFGENKGRNGSRRIAALRDAVSAFMEGSNPSNEYSVIAFNKNPQILLEDSKDSRAVLAALDRLASADLKGFTAMYDTLYLSLSKLAMRPTRKHVVVLLTDGMDNTSRYTFADVRRALRESDVMVYSVGVFVEEDSQLNYTGRAILEEFADSSSGRVFYPDDESGIKAALTQIASELREQYEVAFVPSARAKGDGWHEVRFKLGELRDARGRKVKALVRARRGFYDEGTPRGR
jgi:Ca-activated chloride channel family protein